MVGSLAGIPPLAGFVAKLLIFIAAPAMGARVLMGLLAGATILLGFYQGLFAF